MIDTTRDNWQSAMQRDYTMGRVAPHYPVPAIRTEVEYYPPADRWGVVIYITEVTEGIDNGRYWISHDSVRAWDRYGYF
jgi:hypothetical protein